MIKDKVIIDIDGCLNYYPNTLKMWAEIMLNLDKSESKQAIEEKKDFDFLKETYRQSRIFNYFLPRKDVKEVFEKIKKSGYTITILTSRNIKKNPDIETVTKDWLLKYKIPFDYIVHTKDKEAYVKQNEDRTIMVVEDDPEFLSSFEKLRTEVVVFRNELNRDIKQSHFHKVSSWKEIESLLESLIAK